MRLSQGEKAADGLHGRRVATRLTVGEFRVGFGVVVVGVPFAEGFPANLTKELCGEAAGEDGEFGLAAADEVEVVVDDACCLGFAPDGHRFRGGQFRGKFGGSNRICCCRLRHGSFEVISSSGAAKGFDEESRVAATGEHLGAVVAGVNAVNEMINVETAAEAAVVEGGEDMLDGCCDGVGEGGSVDFGEAFETGKRGFEPGQDEDEFGFIAGHLGGGGIGVDLIDELVECNLVAAGSAGDFLGSDSSVFGG